MYEYEIYKVENGYGFNILCDNYIIIKQDYKPDSSGYEIMTEEEANNYAQEILNRIGGNQ